MANIFYTVSPQLHRVARVEGGAVVELDFEIPGKPPSILGGIFLGRVIEIQKPLQACFVDIGEAKPGLLPLREGKLTPIKHGDAVLVQVDRGENPLEGKGVRLTRLLTLSLGPLLYTPFVPGLSLSKKLKNRETFQKIFSLETEEGVIIRHWASAQDPLENMLTQLRTEWKKIQSQVSATPPLCIVPAPALLARVLRSLGAHDKLLIDDRQLAQKGGVYTREKAFDESCEEAWESLFSPEVPLSKGGSLHIEETRGLTVIDVNSSGALRHSLPFNRLAIQKALHQIRLRELGGKIAMDLISFPKDIHPLLQGLEIPSDLEIYGLSPVGLLEMIRRKKRLSVPQRFKLGVN